MRKTKLILRSDCYILETLDMLQIMFDDYVNRVGESRVRDSIGREKAKRIMKRVKL